MISFFKIDSAGNGDSTHYPGLIKSLPVIGHYEQ